MADQQKIVLELEAKTKKLVAELKKAKKSIKGVDDQTNRMRISTAGLRRSIGALRNNMLLVSFAFGGTAKAVSSLIRAYGEQELAERKLEQALGFTSQALLTQASALQQQTSFGDEAIIGVQALIGAFTKDEEQIKELTKTTLDLAAAKGMDLTAAADLVSKSFGSSTNALSRYGIQVEGAVGSTERLESLTGNVADLFGGQASAQADTMTGSIEQMKNAVGDTAESMGALLEPATIVITSMITKASNAFSNFFTKLKETDAETFIRQLRELKIPEPELTVLQQMIDLETATDSLVGKNEKIEKLLKKQQFYASGRKDLTTDELEILGVVIDQNTRNDKFQQRMIESVNAELATSEKLLPMIKSRTDAVKDLIAKGKDLNKEDEEKFKRLRSELKFMYELLDVMAQREVAEQTIADIGKDAPTVDKLTPEQIFLAQFDEFKKGKDEQLEKYEHEQALISMLVEKHSDLAESLGLETDAQRKNRIESEKAAVEKKKAADQAAKAHEKSTKSVTKDFIKLGKLYGEDADKAQNAAIETIAGYAAEAAASQMTKIIKQYPFPMNAILAATAGAAIGLGINALSDPLKSKKAQYGMNEVVDEPTLILAGEAGAEQVSITTLESHNIDGVQGGGASVVVNVSGNVLTSDFVEGELAENIREAVRRGTDFGIG